MKTVEQLDPSELNRRQYAGRGVAAFRKRFLPQLKGWFVQMLQVARALKLLKVGNVSLDGAKVKANASRHWRAATGTRIGSRCN